MCDETSRAALIGSTLALLLGSMATGIATALGKFTLAGVLALMGAFFGLAIGTDGLTTLLLEVVFRQKTVVQGVKGCLAQGFTAIGSLVLGITGLVIAMLGG